MWASQVTPEQAGSNIAAWITYAGIDDAPAWLSQKSVDDWGYWFGLAGLVVWGFILVYPRLHSKLANGSLVKGKHGERGVILKIKYTDERANSRYMRFDENGVVCTRYLEIINESSDMDMHDVEVKVESYDQITDLLAPHNRTAAFTRVGISLSFERGGQTRTIRRHDSEWVKFLSFGRRAPLRWIQIGEYGQDRLDLHGKIVSVHMPHRLDLTVRAANANPITASFLVKVEHEMLQVQSL